MAKTKQQKDASLTELKDEFGKAKGAVFAGFRGMTVASVSKLRKELRGKNMYYRVAKKTLMQKAAETARIQDFAVDVLAGPTAVVISYEDAVTPAKIVKKFMKEDEHLVIYAGIMDGKMIAKELVLQLASLPGLDELRAKMLGSMMSPVTGFVRVSNGPLTGFVRILNQLSKKAL